MRKWTFYTALEAYLTYKGLTRCSAYDYLINNHRVMFYHFTSTK